MIDEMRFQILPDAVMVRYMNVTYHVTRSSEKKWRASGPFGIGESQESIEDAVKASQRLEAKWVAGEI